MTGWHRTTSDEVLWSRLLRTVSSRTSAPHSGELQVASGISRSTLAREIHYGRSQLYDILDGRIRRPPEWDRLVEPLLRTCLRGKPDLERLVADWRTRYEVLLRVHDELTRRTGRAAEPVPGPLAGLPRVPWLAILDPDVTTTAQSGLYLVYLFDIAVERVFLSMNQGATAHQNYYRQHRPAGTSIDKAALAELVAETTAIRARLDPALLADTEETIDLGADGFLPEGYEAGNVAAVGYELAAYRPSG